MIFSYFLAWSIHYGEHNENVSNWNQIGSKPKSRRSIETATFKEKKRGKLSIYDSIFRGTGHGPILAIKKNALAKV